MNPATFGAGTFCGANGYGPYINASKPRILRGVSFGVKSISTVGYSKRKTILEVASSVVIVNIGFDTSGIPDVV